MGHQGIFIRIHNHNSDITSITEASAMTVTLQQRIRNCITLQPEAAQSAFRCLKEGLEVDRPAFMSLVEALSSVLGDVAHQSTQRIDQHIQLLKTVASVPYMRQVYSTIEAESAVNKIISCMNSVKASQQSSPTSLFNGWTMSVLVTLLAAYSSLLDLGGKLTIRQIHSIARNVRCTFQEFLALSKTTVGNERQGLVVVKANVAGPCR
jgi:hypothetical protein